MFNQCQQNKESILSKAADVGTSTIFPLYAVVLL